MTDGGATRPAPANKTALAARVRNAARSADLPEGRVQRHLGILVVAELLGRVRNENGQQLFLVKGGSSIELRAMHSWPPQLLPPPHWERLFDAAYTTVLEPGQVPPTVQEAAAAVRDIVDLIDHSDEPAAFHQVAIARVRTRAPGAVPATEPSAATSARLEPASFGEPSTILSLGRWADPGDCRATRCPGSGPRPLPE